MSPRLTPPAPRKIADRIARLGAEGSFRVLEAARALESVGRDIIHLEFGEPDFAAPSHVIEAGVRALQAGAAKYVSPRGVPSFREAIAATATARGIPTTADRVIVTSSAKPALLYAALATINPGDEVLIPDPGFPIYPSQVRLAGGTPVRYPITRTAARWALDIDALRAVITPRTRSIWINSPSNPIGWVASDAELLEIATLAAEHDLWIVSDEIYDSLTFDAPSTPSIAALPGAAARTVIVDGFSKRYAMTGWRVGYAILPEALADAFNALIINSTSCAPHFIQLAAQAALEGPQDCVVKFRESFRARRAPFAASLNAIPGFDVPLPPGAFYLFADVKGLLADTGLTSRHFADHLLTDGGVAALPGTDFGPGGEGYLRFSVASAPALLDESARRIAASVAQLTVSA